MFLSVTSGIFPYHTGQAFRFLFKEAGCEIKMIETEPQAANLMVVVAESAQYNPGKTTYYELSLFGESEEIRKYQCQENLQVHILQKTVNE